MVRRPAVEQRVIALLRGDPLFGVEDRRSSNRPAYDAHLFDPHDVELFALLSRHAIGRGLHIRSSGAPYVHDDELHIIAWLAVAQRLAAAPEELSHDPALLNLVFDCAKRLSSVGLKLPPRSMVHVLR